MLRHGLVEEALVELAQLRGLDVARRPHADPAAVLGVRVAARSRSRAA